MCSRIQLRRLSAWLTTTSLCLSTLAPAFAQPASPAGADQAGNPGTDPPALAGRLASITGNVSFHAAGETQWNAATLNYPVTNGEAFWTEPQAGAVLEIADDRLVMDDSTEIDITALDQNQIALTEAQGAVFLQLNSLPAGQGISLTTPRGTVQISAVGRYEIVAGDTNDATTVTVVEGAAHVAGGSLSLDIGPQQTATIGGSDVLQGSVGPMQQDAFLQAQLNVQPRRVAQAAPQRLRYMTGGTDLQEYGSFSQTSDYGQVWFPNDVASNWAPYRDGRWAYVQPWGWTWVDNARWGFAPFHYGRWIQVQNRWGWVPGDGQGEVGAAYPVYSPALVSFVDVGGAALAGAALGFAAGELSGGYAPAWIPLGPREPYYPWYHCRADYFGRVNAPYGVPRTIIDRGPTYINSVTNIRTVNNVFINRQAATVVPAAAFVRGQAIREVARPLPDRFLAQARPVVGRLPVRPTAFTPNLTPAVARRFNVALPRTPVQPVAAGPRVLATQIGRSAPPLRPAALPGNVRPVPASQVQGRPAGIPPEGVRQPGSVMGNTRPEAGAMPRGGIAAPSVARPGLGLPPLRAPGARPEAVPVGKALPPPRGTTPVPGRVTSPNLRPEVSPRPNPATGQPQRLAEPRPGTGLPPSTPAVRPAPSRVQEPAHVGEARPTPRVETQRPAQPVGNSEPTPRTEPTRPPRVEAPRRPAAEAPRPAPRAEPVRPAPRTEAPRPAAPTPRPAPRAEPVRPAPRIEAPRPAAPPPRPVAPSPRPVAPPPRPAPPPAARPPVASAPRPAPQPAKHPPPH